MAEHTNADGDEDPKIISGQEGGIDFFFFFRRKVVHEKPDKKNTQAQEENNLDNIQYFFSQGLP
jgi:hypothetical protein